MRICSFCGQVLPGTMEVFRSSLCPSCGRELKVCLHCTFYSPGAHWDCRESVSEPVAEKDRSNFCDFFRYKQSDDSKSDAGRAGTRNRDSARREFGRLFGDDA